MCLSKQHVLRSITITVRSLLFIYITTMSFALADNKGNLTLTQKKLNFYETIRQAKQTDPWLKGNLYRQQSLESLSRAAIILPAPTISIKQANFVTDSLSLNRDPMGQLQLGINQTFPRGESLAIKQRQLKIQSLQYPYQRQDRQAKIKLTVGSLWLDIFLIRQSAALIEKNKSLFEQLLQVAQTRYASTLNMSHQQAIVLAELELNKVKDKLLALQQKERQLLGELKQWIPQQYGIAITDSLPIVEVTPNKQILNHDLLTDEQTIHYFYQHPAIIALDKKIMASGLNTELNRQKYKPQWSMNAKYGYRDNRDDLLSIGVTFDLPTFVQSKNDEKIKASVLQTEALKTEKMLLLKRMLGQFLSAQDRLEKLLERQALYDNELLAKFHQRTEVAINAYNNDIDDFSEVMRTQIAALYADIERLTLSVNEQKLRLEINYLLTKTEESNHNFNQLNHKE